MLLRRFVGDSLIHRAAASAITVALCWNASAPAALAITRQVFDCGDPNGDTACYLNFLQNGHFYGRSEGEPARGPNPNHLISSHGIDVFGSTDVDTMYNRLNQLHQYYTTKLGRNGPNGLGGTGNGINAPNNVYRAFANADWSTSGLTGCGGDGGGFATTTAIAICKGSANDLDLIGHEAAHIMFRHELALGSASQTGEAGALEEGMADFFGEAFERYLTGSNDWLFRPRIGPNGAYSTRSLADPPSQPQPPFLNSDRYLSPYFFGGTSDNGGIHANAGIIGKAAYLAVEGGEFNGYTIAGIGFDKVEQIWYRSIATYFDSTETFNEAYVDIIQAADDLYGEFEVEQITLALQAVEMHLSRAGLTGDFDNDGDVDGRDFLLWQRGESPNPFNWNDLAAWQTKYGTGMLVSALRLPPSALDVAVPEPSTLWLVFGLPVCLLRRA